MPGRKNNKERNVQISVTLVQINFFRSLPTLPCDPALVADKSL